VGKGDFGLASGQKPDGTHERVWYSEPISPDEIAFEAGVFLLRKNVAKDLKSGATLESPPVVGTGDVIRIEQETEPTPTSEIAPTIQKRTLRLVGTIPPEIWNRLGTKIIPKLKSGEDLKIGIDFSITLNVDSVKSMASDLRQVLEDLGLKDKIRIEG
jgi:hypothetical protein